MKLSKREETLRKRDLRSRQRLADIAECLREIKKVAKEEQVLAIVNRALKRVDQQQAIQ